MTLQPINLALRARFNDQWNRDEITTVYDNQPLSETNDRDAFVRFAIRFNDEDRIATGDVAMHIMKGRIYLQIFVPKESGDAQTYTLSDKFIAIYRNWEQDDPSIVCGTARVEMAPTKEPYFQMNVSVPFEATYLA